MTTENNFDWLTHLSAIQKSYNSTPQAGKLLGHTPLEVAKSEKIEKQVLRNYALKIRKKYLKLSKRSKLSTLNVGDKVRYLTERTQFQKQYLPQFSDQIETITKVFPYALTMYQITNHRRKFYRNELSLTKYDQSKDLYKLYETRETAQSYTRSGQPRNFQLEYLVGTLNSAVKDRHWISQAEYDQLEKDGRLLSNIDK